ncbi:MAG TPA: S8 family serine peptidase, partial [Pyrinomonadaceae bacterium]|nr:S8 family serine peptidase [Pyrinomonadaceae bacterium]
SSQSLAPENPSTFYTPMPGTSMAAPHVTGAAALILSLRPTFTSDEVRQILTSTARRDGFATTAPDDRWGNGKLDVEAAIARAKTARFAVITGVVITGNVLTWETDIPTTSAVRFHTHEGQLQLGKSLGSRTDLTPRTDHMMTLDTLDAGDYVCEVLAYTREGLLTVDDNGGAFYLVQIP